MNLNSVRTLLSLGFFFLKTKPKRDQIRKLYETNPTEANRIAHEYMKKEMQHILDFCHITMEVKGQENIPKDQACLFAANHSGMFDIPLVELSVEDGVGFVAKDSLEKIPGLASWMRLTHCLFLNRGDMKAGLKTIFKGADYLKEGYNMCIFPEGTRSRTGELLEFKAASLKMAQKAKVPVVPVAITGTGDVLENNKYLSIKPNHLTITFHEPLLINDLPRPEQKKAVDMVRQTIADSLENTLAGK